MRTITGTINGCPVTIIDMNAAELQCVICDGWGFHQHFVWYYEEPCCSLHPEKGGAPACKPCHDRWAAWDDLMIKVAEARGVEAILGSRYDPKIAAQLIASP